ncbi:MAG: Hsp33 family molecular chaperone HslO [Clostridia bacterium]|nr:Hsp33 family molecular chaperone HslO [Clostridia bacterium]
MQRKDILRRYLAHHESVRVIVIDGTNMVEKARDIHGLSNVATASLGRTMMISTIMSSMFKEASDKLTIQIKGDGPIGNIVVCGDNSLKMKGYVTNPNVELPLNSKGKLDVAGAVGKGDLTVIKDIGLKEPYIGNCELLSSEIAEDFAYFFASSEQTPSVVSLGVNIGKDNHVQKACGYIIQPLPDCDQKIIDLLESINLNIPSVSSLMTDIEQLDEVAKTITGDNQIEFLEEDYPIYQCDCSSERIEKTIIALGEDEAIKILEENHGILELTCNFCNKSYQYNKNQVQKLFHK